MSTTKLSIAVFSTFLLFSCSSGPSDSETKNPGNSSSGNSSSGNSSSDGFTNITHAGVPVPKITERTCGTNWQTIPLKNQLKFTDHDNSAKWFEAARFGINILWSPRINWSPPIATDNRYVPQKIDPTIACDTYTTPNCKKFPYHYAMTKVTQKRSMFSGMKNLPIIDGKQLVWGDNIATTTFDKWTADQGLTKEQIEAYNKVDAYWKQWNPTEFNADDWIKVFVDSGAQYLRLPAHTHYGFTTFDTPASTYDIMSTKIGRDLSAELVKAADNQIPIQWHYVQDGGIDHVQNPWHYIQSMWSDNIKLFTDFRRQSVAKLIRDKEKYGCTSALVWYGDVGGKINGEHPERIKHGAHREESNPEKSTYYSELMDAQPWMLSSKGFPKKMWEAPGYQIDFSTNPIGHGTMPTYPGLPANLTKLGNTEMELTLDALSYWVLDNRPQDTNSAQQILHNLVNTAARDSNLILMVAPNDKGLLQSHQKQTLHKVGTWLRKYGKSIFDTRAGPYAVGPWGGSTRIGNKAYLHFTALNTTGKYILPALDTAYGDQIESMKLLNNNSNVTWSNSASDGLEVNMDASVAKNANEVSRIVEITFSDGFDAMDVPIITNSGFTLSYARPAKITASEKGTPLSSFNLDGTIKVDVHKPSEAGIGEGTEGVGRPTYWTGIETWEPSYNATQHDITLDMDLKGIRKVRYIRIGEHFSRITSWKLQAKKSDTDSWSTLFDGTNKPLGRFDLMLPADKDIRYLRLVFMKTEGGPPQITYWRVYRP